MADHDDIVEELDAAPVAVVQDEVGRRLERLQWRRLEHEPQGPAERGAFAFDLAEDFAVTFRILPWVESSSRGGELAALGIVGLDYTPAREMTASLVGRAYSGVVFRECHVASVAGEGSVAKAVDDLVQFASAQRSQRSAVADLDLVVGMLIRDAAVASTRPTAFLDETINGNDDRAEVLVAMLAAAGRYGQARHILVSLATAMDHRSERARLRFVRQLTRWIDADGALALPSSPPQWGRRPPPPGLAGIGFRRDEHIARREALNATRSAGQGKSRDELRPLLEAEYRQRRMSVVPPRIERDIDLLLAEQQSMGRLRIAVRGLRALAAFGSESRTPGGGLDQVLADTSSHEVDDLAETLRLPARAAYPVYGSGQPSTTITIDPEADGLLARILQTTTHAEASVPIQVSLTPSLSPERIEVNIGEHLVGHLSGPQAAHFTPAMNAAAERDEVPWTVALLVSRPEPPAHLLCLAVPDLAVALSADA